MDKTQEPKKCFCARCFHPISVNDKVDIDGQNFHRHCSMCCVCRMIPTSLKMFYGHVFCTDCFNMHVMSRFKGESPRMYSNSWWMQWAPGVKPHDDKDNKKNEDCKNSPPSEEQCKRCICARCLQVVNDTNKVEIGEQSFHTQCARCYFCHTVPKDKVKIYYGQVFCDECFHKRVLNRGHDNPTEFFKNCFEQWQTNAQFAEMMREMMAGNKEATPPPFIFMAPSGQPPFCRCGNSNEWTQQNESRKSATPALSIGGDSTGTCLSFENRTDASDGPQESAVDDASAAAVEKIEKLTKYLHDRTTKIPVNEKKWQNYELEPMSTGWVDMQDPKIRVESPRCLWQCGTIYVHSDLLNVRCGEN